MDGPPLIPFAIGFFILILAVLAVSTKFFPLMDAEKRRREGIPYDDLLENKPPGKLLWTVFIVVHILVLIWVL